MTGSKKLLNTLWTSQKNWQVLGPIWSTCVWHLTVTEPEYWPCWAGAADPCVLEAGTKTHLWGFLSTRHTTLLRAMPASLQKIMTITNLITSAINYWTLWLWGTEVKCYSYAVLFCLIKHTSCQTWTSTILKLVELVSQHLCG